MQVRVSKVRSGNRNVYAAEIEFMHGDTDAKSSVEVVLRNLDEVKALLDLVAAWHGLSGADHWKMREGESDIATLPGFDVVFGNRELWPEDVTCVDVCPERLADLIDYKLFWYDMEGIQYNVEITEE